MTARARAVETTPAEPASESRRRVDRARSTTRAPESGTEQDSTSRPRLAFSVTNIPTMPAGSEEGAQVTPDTELPGLAAAPAPGVSAEQVAAREAQTAAAVASLENSQDSPGLMQAFTAAPPTVKARVSGELGSRLTGTLGQETTKISQGTPEIAANMNGNTPTVAGTIAPPAATDISLEPNSPPPIPAPDAVVGAPVRTDGAYSANGGVVVQLRNNFSAESGAREVERALDNVQTSDPNIIASPGTPPSVPLQGETDPQRFQNQTSEGARQANETLAQQHSEVRTLPGAERVQLADVHVAQTVGELIPPAVEAAPAPEGAQQYLALSEPPEVQTAFDEIAAAPMQASLANAQSQIDKAASDRDTQHQSDIRTAQEKTSEAQRTAEGEQGNQVAEAQRSIAAERTSTMEAQQTAVSDMRQQAETRRETDRSQFDDRTRSNQQQIDDRYTLAERDASTEIAEGERQARAKRDKSERESNDRSWWEAAWDFIASVFDALVAAISFVFDAVRSAVNKILNAARDFAVGLIRLAAEVLKGLVEAFGTFLKGLVQGLLGTIFPDLARALIAAIDNAVNQATRAIDTAANALVAAVNFIVETLRAAIMTLINVYQAAVNAALALARAALTGDWSGFLLQLLEAACRVVGIDPQQIYNLIGRARDTIQIIVDNPGQFFSNLLESLLGGFRRFAGNFVAHLQTGIIGWLTGALGGAGITIPARFDLMGVIGLVGQILGLTWENLRQRIVRFVGERGTQVIEFVAGYVQTLIQGGWSALWERIQQDLGALRDMVFEQIRTFLVERIIMGAVTRLATLFNPVGALVNIVLAAYQFYTFIRDQLQRIMQVVTTVVDAISNIARSILGPAQERIEGFLAGLLPLAIDLLARLIGLGNVGGRVREILQRVQDSIWRAIDRLIERVVGLFRDGGSVGESARQDVPRPETAGEALIGETIAISTREGTHSLYIIRQGNNAVEMVASNPSTVQQRIADWRNRVGTLRSDIRPGEQESPQTKGFALLARAETELGQADQAADLLARQAGVSAESRPPSNAEISSSQVVREEQQLASVLRQLFDLFGGDAGTTRPHDFTTDLNHMPQGARAYATEKLNNDPSALALASWQAARAWLLTQQGFQLILGEGSRVGTEDTVPRAREGAKRAVVAATNGQVAAIADEDAKDIVNRSKSKVHSGQGYQDLRSALTNYAFDQSLAGQAETTAQVAYRYPDSPDARFVLDEIPASDDQILSEYDNVVLPLVRSGQVRGNAEGLRNQFEGTLRAKKYMFASGFRTQLQQVLSAGKRRQQNSFPQLSGVEIAVAGGRADYTQRMDASQHTHIIHEVKNWSGWGQKTDSERTDIIMTFRRQSRRYLLSDIASNGELQFGGLVLQIKGAVPTEATPVLSELSDLARERGKFFKLEYI